MGKLFQWLKTHKALTVLILVLVYLGLRSFFGMFIGSYSYGRFASGVPGSADFDSFSGVSNPSYSGSLSSPLLSEKSYTAPSAGNSNTADRKVVTNSQMSLVVKDVTSTADKIESEVTRIGGFVVTRNINRPEEGATGYVTVRVPAEKLKDFQGFLRTNAVKVVSENIQGTDITDQYTDVQARLDILNRNKQRYTEIMEKAESIDDILRIQQQIFSLQDQIDRLKGQLMLMEKSANMSLLSINLGTDELSLPYAPDNAWRPQVVFKQAVRALVGTLRGLGTLAIWVGVYSVIWIPIIIIIKLVRRALRRRNNAV